MPSNKMRLFIARHPEMSAEQIEQERQRRIHHTNISPEERAKMHGWVDLPNQDTLF